MKFKCKCDWCGKEFYRFPSQIHKHNFCSREYLASFCSREKNPGHYEELKDYTNISAAMRRTNEKLNPERMTPTVRRKLRAAKYGKGSGKSYPKLYGRHEHRVVAEQMLGRKLRPGEVIHHIDGNKRNNDPSNLMVFSTQSEHAKFHQEQERLLCEFEKIEAGGDAS
jgi:hypothetical protein